MKAYMLKVAIVACLSAIAPLAEACGTSGATVTQVFQWDDGYIFVNLSHNTDCACPIPNRVAFHKDDNEKLLMATVLMALSTQKTVFVRAVENNCAIQVKS